jgi:putative membrane protein
VFDHENMVNLEDFPMSELNDPRVLFAAERTLLAWNRTSLALIAFGFAVERAGLLVKLLNSEAKNSAGTGDSFWLGLTFILVGAFTAFYSSKQYAAVLKTLRPAEFPQGYGAKWGMWVNVLVAVLGVMLVVGLIVERI